MFRFFIGLGLLILGLYNIWVIKNALPVGPFLDYILWGMLPLIVGFLSILLSNTTLGLLEGMIGQMTTWPWPRWSTSLMGMVAILFAVWAFRWQDYNAGPGILALCLGSTVLVRSWQFWWQKATEADGSRTVPPKRSHVS
jgi:hypothetical protein